MKYHVMEVGKADTWEILVTEDIEKAKETAKSELCYSKGKVIEIRVYADEDEQLDYDIIPLTWYAILMDEEDADWGTGSYDLDKAMAQAEDLEALKIAVIEMDDDPTCIDEIYMYDSFRVSAIYSDGSNQDCDIVNETGSDAIDRELESAKQWFEVEVIEDAKRWSDEEEPLEKPEYYLISYYRDGECYRNEEIR